ncbi:MAG: hypothetical protein ACLRXQ_04270 [Phascolarctobacterium faecium]
MIADAEKALLAEQLWVKFQLLPALMAKVEAIAPHRWTERYEEPRMRTENFVDKTGANVKIFLANMGPITAPKHADLLPFMQVAALRL